MSSEARRTSREVDALVEEARAAERAGRFLVARQRYEGALEKLGGTPDPARASALVRWIGRTHEAEGDLGAAHDCYEAALATAEAAGSAEDHAHVLNCLAIVAFRRGELEEARRLYQEARLLAAENGMEQLVAMVDQNLGNVANVHGDHALAEINYNLAIQGFRRLDLIEYIGPLLLNIGRVHIDLGRWREAATAFDTAEANFASAGEATMTVLVHVHRTRLHLARGDYEAARDACDDAMECSLGVESDRWLGEILMNAGIVSRELGRARIAEHRFDLGLAEAVRREDLLLEAEIRRETALLFRDQRRNREMLECLNRAHEAFAKLRATPGLADVGREIDALERSFEEIVATWGNSIESADRYTHGHCVRVADLACELASAAGFDKRSETWFRMGALLHDVGKVDVPAEVLNKAGPLSDAEWAVMKRHPEAGVELLADVEFPWDIRPMVLHHHEHWDGGGYPHGIQGEEIPLSARVLCVADVYDALTTTRSYRSAYTPDVALEIMRGDSGHIFDPGLFELFEAIIRRRLAARSASAAWLPNVAFRPESRGAALRPPVHAVA